MGLNATEALKHLLQGTEVRDVLHEMEAPEAETNDYDEGDLEDLLDLEDEYSDLEEEDLTDEEFDDLLSDVEFESESEITERMWRDIKVALEKKVRKVKGGKVVTVDKKRKKKKRLSSKQKAALKKAQKKSRTGSAKKSRAKSMKKRKQSNL